MIAFICVFFIKDEVLINEEKSDVQDYQEIEDE